MKEITDEYADKLSKHIDLKFEEGMYTLTMGKHKISQPRVVVRSLEKKVKLYEADDIEDVLDNYDLLLKKKISPLIALLWGIKNYSKMTSDPEFVYSLENFTRYDDPQCDKKFLGINLNFAGLDNVYLDNFNFIEEARNKCVEFDIRDWHQEVIRGAFIYERYPNYLNKGREKEQLRMVLDANEATPFDITFQALPGSIIHSSNERIFHREILLNVLSIKRKRGDKETIDTPSEASPYFIPSLVS
ncbi:MAG: hypothetical protein AABW50_02115 [Nanoarchaeota archaeon]